LERRAANPAMTARLCPFEPPITDHESPLFLATGNRKLEID
jgi:hypothetical protein